MREKRNHSVRSSSLQSREPRKKYFLVYEGVETEPIYFDALSKYMDYSRISPLIDMVPIIRGISKEGWSNPQKLLNGFIADLHASMAGTITYNTLIDCIVNEACPDQVSPMTLCKSLKAIFKTSFEVKDLDSSVPVPEIESICKRIEDETELSRLVETIPKIIKEYAITFDPKYDRIGFVIDRDKHSFKVSEGNNQYEYVLSKCFENDFGFFLSNPCFEFWLLLHFQEIKNLDQEKLLDNPKLNSDGKLSKNGKTYTERELGKLLPGYKKNRFDIEALMTRIDIAIQQEKDYCEDPEKLENHIGSRIGILIQELREM